MAAIVGAERVTEIYGRWPAFHDAEVLRVRLDHDGAKGAALEADIHIFAMTPELDAGGCYVLCDHHVVTLRFDGLSGLDLRWFGSQNVVSTLDIDEAGDPDETIDVWKVDFGSSVGMAATFQCAKSTVMKLVATASSDRPERGGPSRLAFRCGRL